LVNVSKRYLIAAAAHNLGRLLRRLCGIGKPKSLQGEGGLAALVHLLMAPIGIAWMSLCFVLRHAVNWFRLPDHALTRRRDAQPTRRQTHRSTGC
jgi:hypothetical protein